ncbi:hypothetical protein [Granulicella arctica]|uniref:Uncharacterized protein n=1 Tax=Granulicella arctica TaxID=940613 RepID=A0A7Y9PDZ1_9BACT|nr:hypothetical protein [Granulicella arctica]NYF78047.1 hypothetical protein [Granulicella arctica]
MPSLEGHAPLDPEHLHFRCSFRVKGLCLGESLLGSIGIAESILRNDQQEILANDQFDCGIGRERLL